MPQSMVAMEAKANTVDTPDMDPTVSATDTEANSFTNNNHNISSAMDHAPYGLPQPMDMDVDTDHTEQRVINYSIIQIRV